jgi:hypothetical protein
MGSLLDSRPLTKRQQAIMDCLGEIGSPVELPALAILLQQRGVIGGSSPRSQTRQALVGLIIRGLVERVRISVLVRCLIVRGRRRHEWKRSEAYQVEWSRQQQHTRGMK